MKKILKYILKYIFNCIKGSYYAILFYLWYVGN